MYGRIVGIIAVLWLGAAAMAGASPPATTTASHDEPTPARAGFLVGTIRDAEGKPLKDATYRVQVVGFTAAGERSQFDVAVDENGKFTERLPAGIYHVYGWVTLDYHDREYKLPLCAMDGQTDEVARDVADGIVKDFRLKLSGRKPGKEKKSPNSYWGGVLDVGEVWANNALVRLYPVGSTIQFTLTAEGPLVDGSVGKERTFEYKLAKPDDDMRGNATRFIDVPLGAYTMTATLTEPSGAKHSLSLATGDEAKFLVSDRAEPLKPAAPKQGLYQTRCEVLFPPPQSTTVQPRVEVWMVP